MITAQLSPNPAASSAGAPSPGSAPSVETLASAFAGLLALLTGATQPLPNPKSSIGQARPIQPLGGPSSPQPAEPGAARPAVGSTMPGHHVPPAPGPHAMQASAPGQANLATAGSTAARAGGPMAPNQSPTGTNLPDRQGSGPEASAPPSQVLALTPADTTALASAAGEPALDLNPSLAPLRPASEAPVGASKLSAPAPPPQPAPSAPGAQIQLQITRAVTEHVDHIRVRLEPPELGHVEIKLHVGDDNRFTGVVTVDRSETLDLLQRDAAALERGLRDAGLRADGGGLSFTLRRDQQENGGGQSDGAGTPTDAQHGAPAEAGADGSHAELGLDLQRLLDIRA